MKKLLSVIRYGAILGFLVLGALIMAARRKLLRGTAD